MAITNLAALCDDDNTEFMVIIKMITMIMIISCVTVLSKMCMLARNISVMELHIPTDSPGKKEKAYETRYICYDMIDETCLWKRTWT